MRLPARPPGPQASGLGPQELKRGAEAQGFGLKAQGKTGTDPAERLGRILGRVRARGLRVLVLGIGNEMLGDDAVGVLVARDLEALNDASFLSVPVEIGVENAGHLVRRHRPDVLILVDAVAAPGRAPWRFVPPSRLGTFCHSTHSVPLSLLIRVWKQDAPKLAVHFIGVRPHLVALGAPLSPEVAAARTEIAGAFTSLT